MIFPEEYELPCPVCGQLTFWYDHERGYRICLNDECGHKETSSLVGSSAVFYKAWTKLLNEIFGGWFKRYDHDGKTGAKEEKND